MASCSAAAKGDDAKEILREHYATLAHSIIAPVQLGQELFQKKVISEHSLREIETEGSSLDKKNTSLLRSVRVAIGQNHVRLGILAKLVMKYEETSSVGEELLRKYGKNLTISVGERLIIIVFIPLQAKDLDLMN